MDEPEYRYVRGVGWVTGGPMGDYITFTFGGYTVTLTETKVKPEVGQMYFTEFIDIYSDEPPRPPVESLRDVLRRMTYWNTVFNNTDIEQVKNHIPKWDDSRTEYDIGKKDRAVILVDVDL